MSGESEVGALETAGTEKTKPRTIWVGKETWDEVCRVKKELKVTWEELMDVLCSIGEVRIEAMNLPEEGPPTEEPAELSSSEMGALMARILLKEEVAHALGVVLRDPDAKQALPVLLSAKHNLNQGEELWMKKT